MTGSPPPTPSCRSSRPTSTGPTPTSPACGPAPRQATEIADNAAQEVDSAIAKAHLNARLRSLDTEVDGLAFGRLDAEDGDTWYVGRRHVEDEAGDPVVVDWRAPVSTPFYRATAADPLELQRRRRFLMTARQVDDLFDEVFDDPDSVDAAHHGGIPDPLLAELERSRTGEMRDIVATIAAEQDVVIRAPLDTCLVVQGGPGTGKTAVGLHRAAFLLFEHREQLDREGVLVVGPNPLFLQYIAQVLPSLGEAATRQTTVERLVGGRVAREDPPEVARLKGDARMAAAAAWPPPATTCACPTEDLSVATAWGRLRIPAADLADAVEEIVARDVPVRGRSQRLPHAGAPARLARAPRLEVGGRRARRPPSTPRCAPTPRSTPRWRGSGRRCRRRCSSSACSRTGGPSRRRPTGCSTPTSSERLLRPPGAKRLDDEPWSLPELVLVDEAEAVLNGVGPHLRPRGRGRGAGPLGDGAARRRPPLPVALDDRARRPRPGHRARGPVELGRRGRAPRLAADRVDRGARARLPGAGADPRRRQPPAARRWRPACGPARSVRLDGPAPSSCRRPPDDLPARTAGEVRALATAWSSVGLVVPGAVARAGGGRPRARRGSTSARVPAAGSRGAVTLLDPPEAKGLEFDAVVVVEPSAIHTDERGGRLLYIALTRAVQALAIVHAEPLPAALVA